MLIRTNAKLLNPTSALVTRPQGMEIDKKEFHDNDEICLPPQSLVQNAEEVTKRLTRCCIKKWREVSKSGHGKKRCVSPNMYLLYELNAAENTNHPNIGRK